MDRVYISSPVGNFCFNFAVTVERTAGIVSKRVKTHLRQVVRLHAETETITFIQAKRPCLL